MVCKNRVVFFGLGPIVGSDYNRLIRPARDAVGYLLLYDLYTV